MLVNLDLWQGSAKCVLQALNVDWNFTLHSWNGLLINLSKLISLDFVFHYRLQTYLGKDESVLAQ